MAQHNVGAKAKQILAVSSTGGFKLLPDSLESILLSEDVSDKPVIVVSVAGAFRMGKSFLLDMMLRYLRASDKSCWVDKQGTPGFPWQGGYQRHTTGILMWSEPFPVTLPTGEEAVIVLMDTQGTFDSQSTLHESSTVFALSTLLSSLQIYNVMGKLQSDDLEHLQLFTEYGRMALDQDASTKPFQKLLFLVRDWQFINHLQLGAEGGDKLVAEWLQNQSGKKELEKVRQHIRDCFSEINGFLLPHPGKQVTSNLNFDGSSSDMDDDFVDGLKELVPRILAPENLTVKTIAGNPVKARDLNTFFAKYIDLFQSDKLPKPKSIMQATAEANNIAVVQEARSQYTKEMEIVCLEDKSLDQAQLLRRHREAAKKAEGAFNARRKMGDWKTSEKYREKLVQEMEEWFTFADQVNNAKREKERMDAKQYNTLLKETCKMAYAKSMESAVGGDGGFVPLKALFSVHEAIKKKTMDRFDAEKRVFGVDDVEICYELSQDIVSMFQQTLFCNSMNKDDGNRKATLANMEAMDRAKGAYQSMMNAMTSTGELTEEDINSQHQQALKVAMQTFDALREGDECMTTSYLDSMKRYIERELDGYIRENQLKTEVNMLKARLKSMKEKMEKEELGSSSWCTLQ